jgi:cytochrome c556
MSMVDLAAAMTTIAVDLSEQDVENAANGFARFKTVYAEAAELVPEWRDRYPGGPVQELGDALAGGDPEKVMAAFGAVGAVCSDCHRATMAAVQHLYHWPDPRAITASDPVTGEKVDFIRFMHQLDFSLTGVTADAVQGQVEASRRHFRDFRARFGILAEICQECHGTEERRYFTDATAHALVERLGASLANATPDLDAVTKAAAAVGHETCFRCHLVHIPAALARAQHR